MEEHPRNPRQAEEALTLEVEILLRRCRARILLGYLGLVLLALILHPMAVLSAAQAQRTYNQSGLHLPGLRSKVRFHMGASLTFFGLTYGGTLWVLLLAARLR